MAREKLWNYARISRVWALTLVAAAPVLLLAGALLEAGDPKDGLQVSWIPIALGSFASAALVFFFLLRLWMRPTAVPTGRLDDARRDKGKPALAEATTRDWRVWTAVVVVMLMFGSFVMMMFLIGILGGGGMAEGVVAGVLLAWGLVTLEDVRRLEAIEADEGRTYYAACKRPVAVGSVLVWRAAARDAATERTATA